MYTGAGVHWQVKIIVRKHGLVRTTARSPSRCSTSKTVSGERTMHSEIDLILWYTLWCNYCLRQPPGVLCDSLDLPGCISVPNLHKQPAREDGKPHKTLPRAMIHLKKSPLVEDINPQYPPNSCTKVGIRECQQQQFPWEPHLHVYMHACSYCYVNHPAPACREQATSCTSPKQSNDKKGYRAALILMPSWISDELG